ncbi:histidine kinase [Romboutsia maritimum]|uniref:histidine kinase n=1 Tax=Romboutsia maritimum TaxID=2020948 RepID=A0A371IT74_9FIRM|nr:sensor histidine kinase [Romboutsia maritimum]RDY23680.1 histidine kinase [Romboutsia maritimum]
MINKIAIKIFIVFLFIFYNTYSIDAYDNIQFKNLTIENGLSQSSVETLIQDSKGYIWLGTNDGLNRYDGYNFKVYKHDEDNPNSIINNYIISIEEDKNGNIWVGTADGLSKINSKDDSITNYTNSKDKGNLSNSNICDISITKNGRVMIATLGGINVYDEKEDKFKKIFDDKNFLPSQVTYNIEEDEFGDFWIATSEGVCKLDSKTKKIHNFNEKGSKNYIENKVVYLIYNDHKGYIWVGTFKHGLEKINIKTNEVTSYTHKEGDNNSLPSDFVKDILKDRYGNVWVCTDKGFAKYKENGKFVVYEAEDYSHSLIDNNIFSIIEDRSGLIWIGTYKGISIFDPNNKIELYQHEKFDTNSLSGSSIHGIYEDEDKLTWVGTDDDGINLIDRSTEKVSCIDEKNGLSSGRINDILGKGDIIWVATDNGLNKINRKTKQIKVYNMKDGINYSNIRSIFLDSKGYLWIGTKNGINILNDKDDTIRDITPILTKNSIYDYNVKCIYEDSDGNYWLGMFVNGGLVKIDAKNKKIKSFKGKLSSNSIRTITEDNDGYIWVGTSYGLNRLSKSNNDIERYTRKEGLSSDTIYGILIDKHGNPWMSTNNGISKFDKKNKKFKNLNITDGLQGNEFNGGAYYKNKSGEFLFGGINGLNILNPEKIVIQDNCPKVQFDEFYIKGEKYKNIHNTELLYSENNISLKYFLPDYKNNKSVQYFYKMSSVDSKWNLTSNNEVIYTNLAPGKYKFQIFARNYNGSTSEISSVSFKIKTSPWLSPLAFIVYLIIAILLIYLNINKVKRLDNLVNKKTKQLREEMEKNKNLYEKVIKLEKNKNNYFVNLSHELRTPLNVISTTEQLIIELNKNKAGISKERISYHLGVMIKNTRRLLNLINNIIDTTKIEHGSYKLNIKQNDIVYIVEETALGLKDYIESKGIELIIDPEIEEKLIECDKYEIERCIVNLVSNAAKFTSIGGKIEVSIKELYEKVIIIVRDNGIGIDSKHQAVIFDRFNQVIDSNSESKGGSGLGLAITKQIVELHQGEISVKSELNKGSTFTIILPINQK